MKRLPLILIVLFLSPLAWGQCATSNSASSICGNGTGISSLTIGSGSGQSVINGVSSGSLPTANAQLPLFFAKSKGSLLVPSYDVTKKADGTDYATTLDGLQKAYCDWAFSGLDQSELVKVPHGAVIQTGTAATCTQTGATTYRSLTLLPKIVNGALPTKYIVFDSDTPLPEGTTVCSHATDDTAVRQPPTGDISTWWGGGVANNNYGCGNDRGSMWTLEGNWASPGNAGELIQAGQWDNATNLGPAKVIFKNVELRPLPTLTASLFLVQTSIDAAFSTPTLLSQMPSDIHFINIYAHGDAKDWCETNNPLGLASCTVASSYHTGGPGNNKIDTAVKLTDCQNCSVTFSYFDYIISQGAENHLIGISRSAGPDKITHNYLSSGSMAFFTGGIASFDPLYSLFDLEFRGNYLTNPISWIGANYHGTALTLKNRLELKTGQRVLIEGNFCEWQDTSGAQDGQCFGINPRACSAGKQCDNYQVADQDITIRNNIIRHALTGISDAAYSSYPSNGGGAAAPVDRLTIAKNLFYDLGSAFFDQHLAVSHPFALRTAVGGPAFLCSGVNTAGVQTYTCDGSVTGLQQTQIRPGDNVVITNCSAASWDYPAVGTAVWLTTKGTPALAGTLPGGLSVVVGNGAAVGATATGCILQAQGAPYHQIVQHNTFVMQTDVYPYGQASGPTADPVNGTASIAAGVATVTVTNKPIVVPNVGKVTVTGASINAYNCTVCLVTATTTTAPYSISYRSGSGVFAANIDDTLAGWTTCIKPSCDPGGTGIPSSTSQTINNSSPSMDGKSMQVSLTGPAFTNALWYDQQGAQNSATSFHSEFNAYVTGGTIQAIEYDNYQFLSPNRFMWGSECVPGGVWDIWNGLTQSWVHTAITCTFALNSWHHISWDIHRVAGDVSCSGHPCMYYDKLVVDSNTYTGFTPQPSDPLPAGWANQTGPQFQLDLNGSGGTATEYLDNISFSSSPNYRAAETVVTGVPLMQPDNNGAIYNGNSTVNIFTDTGCFGAGPNNSTAVTAWSRTGGIVSATIATTTGWTLAPIVSPQIIVESTGNGTATGTFYYLGRTGSVVKFSQPGADETGATFGTLAQTGTCPGQSFSVGDTYKNNLIVVDQGTAPNCPGTSSTGWVGWNTSGNGPLEGCRNGTGNANCAENHLDAFTSTATNADFPGRCARNYMEMGGGHAGSIPPVTLTFPLTTVCAGATVPFVTVDGLQQPSCVGMKSMMNGAAFDISDPDYHQYVLDNSSPYKAGGLLQADDGTDLGIGTLTDIDNANHSLLFVCDSVCGTPYPD